MQRWEYMRALGTYASQASIEKSKDIDHSVRGEGWLGKGSPDDPWVRFDHLMERLGADGWELVAAYPQQMPVVRELRHGALAITDFDIHLVDLVIQYVFKRPKSEQGS